MRALTGACMAVLVAFALLLPGCGGGKTSAGTASGGTGLENLAEQNVVRPREKAEDAAAKANEVTKQTQQELDDALGETP